MDYRQIANADEAKLCKTLVYVISLLVNKQYKDMVNFTKGRDLEATTIQQIVEDWPSPLILPLSDRIEDLVYTVQSTSSFTKENGKCWLIDALLYSQSEGRSDLTLKLIVDDSPGELYQVIVDDLGVM